MTDDQEARRAGRPTGNEEIDIYRSAQLLIREHGADAEIHAAMMADEMLERGDLDGRATWLRILRAIDVLRSDKPPDGNELQ